MPDLDSAIIEELTRLGFKLVQTIGKIFFYGKISETPAQILGDFPAIPSQFDLVNRLTWASGPLIAINPKVDKYVLTENFWLLESPYIPRSTLSLRDHFDYGVETELKYSFPTMNPIIGPYWLYIFESNNVADSFKKHLLRLASPLLGNAIMCSSDDITVLYGQYHKVKEHILKIIPLPIIWGHPFGFSLGVKNSIYDNSDNDWYMVSVEMRKSGELVDIPLADLSTENLEDGHFLTHEFQHSRAIPYKVKPNDITIKLFQASKKLRIQRKLSKITIVFN